MYTNSGNNYFLIILLVVLIIGILICIVAFKAGKQASSSQYSLTVALVLLIFVLPVGIFYLLGVASGNRS